MAKRCLLEICHGAPIARGEKLTIAVGFPHVADPPWHTFRIERVAIFARDRHVRLVGMRLEGDEGDAYPVVPVTPNDWQVDGDLVVRRGGERLRVTFENEGSADVELYAIAFGSGEAQVGATVGATVGAVDASPPIAPGAHAERVVSTSGPTSGSPRLEHGIELRCCGRPCKLAGNLALRGAGSPVTRLGYECVTCHRRLQVVDEWGHPSAEQLAAYDETP